LTSSINYLIIPSMEFDRPLETGNSAPDIGVTNGASIKTGPSETKGIRALAPTEPVSAVLDLPYVPPIDTSYAAGSVDLPKAVSGEDNGGSMDAKLREEVSRNEDIITLEPLSTGDQTRDNPRTTALVVTQRDELKGMGSALKYRITGQIGSHRVSLVERFDHENFSENWKTYKEAGLPVVPTMRKTDYNTVLMTDLRADNSEIYGKSIIRQLKESGDEREGTAFEPPLGVDERFLELTHPDNIGAIEAEIDNVVALANEKGIRLPTDDPMELVVNQNGWKMMILDLEETGPNNDTRPNNTAKETVLGFLTFARERMLAQQRRVSS
jgi:hypothetical protein